MFGLIGYGLLLIYSSAVSGDAASGPFLEHPTTRQGIYAIAGFVILLLAAGFDYKILGRYAPFLYVTMLLSLGSVLVFGRSIYGAKRWIELPFLNFQPSELAKLIVIIVLARFFADRADRIGEFKTFVLSMMLLVPPVGLIFLQPDVGTLIVVAMIWVGMSIIAGVRLRFMLGLVVLGLIALPKVYDVALHSYMRDRIEVFLNPDLDPLGRGYNVIQAEISIGSGGLMGKGLLNGTQTQLNYLRVQNTDFIFSVLGEEFGYIGAMVLFSLFVILLFRSLNAASAARDNFGRLVVTGVVITILVQAFINIAVNVRLLPATGIPLPFVSYGGTALLTLMLALGVVESVQARRTQR